MGGMLRDTPLQAGFQRSAVDLSAPSDPEMIRGLITTHWTTPGRKVMRNALPATA